MADEAGNNLGTPVDVAVRRWNDNEFPVEAGHYPDIKIFGDKTVYFEDGFGGRVPSTFLLDLLVKQELFLGKLPITQFSGFLDQLSGDVIGNVFTIGLLDPERVRNEWQPIASINELPKTPILRFRGLWAWPEEELAEACAINL